MFYVSACCRSHYHMLQYRQPFRLSLLCPFYCLPSVRRVLPFLKRHCWYPMNNVNLNIITWNVGLNAEPRKTTVHETLRDTSCHIIGLQETKLHHVDDQLASYIGGYRLLSYVQRRHLALLALEAASYFGMIGWYAQRTISSNSTTSRQRDASRKPNDLRPHCGLRSYA